MGMVLINGLMIEFIKVFGKIIKCMGKEFSLGKMEEDTRESMLRIKNMDLENFIGVMEDIIKDNGQMENKVELEFIEVLMLLKEKENGIWGKN